MLKFLQELCQRAAKTVLHFCWNLQKNSCRLITCSFVFTRAVTTEHPCCARSVSWALRLFDRVILSSLPDLTLSSWLTASSETPLTTIKMTLGSYRCSVVLNFFPSYPHTFAIPGNEYCPCSVQLRFPVTSCVFFSPFSLPRAVFQ